MAVDFTNSPNMTKFYSLTIPGDPNLSEMKASENNRDIMDFLDDLQNKFCPMSYDK
jgi:hypothetical protein